jgi:hypothetical protein
MASAGVLWLRVIETATIDEGCGIMNLFLVSLREVKEEDPKLCHSFSSISDV